MPGCTPQWGTFSHPEGQCLFDVRECSLADVTMGNKKDSPETATAMVAKRGEVNFILSVLEVDRLPWRWGYGCCVVLCWMDGKRCEEEKRGREEEGREEAGFVYVWEPWWQQRCCADCEEAAWWSCGREGVCDGGNGSRCIATENSIRCST